MASVDNLLDYMDESFFLDFQAQGHGPMIQFTWIYGGEVDMSALRRFHHELGRGLLGRCVEPSPLPGGRSRWVAWSPPAGFDVAAAPRPRSELTAWTDELAALPISLVDGPPWRMGVLPLAEGGTAVSLVVSHAVADGVGMNNSVLDAVKGTAVDLGYPGPHSRTVPRALVEDAGQLVRDLPRTLKALVMSPLAAKAVPLRLRPGAKAGSGGLPVKRGSNASSNVVVAQRHRAWLPSIAVLVDTEHWDEVAKGMGGTSNSLLIGLSARICELVGWLDEDGLANVLMPVNERTPGDTRGNALTSASLTVDPAQAQDLGGIRAAVKAALTRLTETRDRIMAPLALMPFVPKFLANRFQTVLQHSAAVTVSHFGDLDPAVNRPDGTDADLFYARHARTPDMADPALLRRAGGILFPIASGRLGGRIYISLCYSNAEATTTTEQLTAVARQALDEFGLTAYIEGEPTRPVTA